ncbi:uroporphyrinogen-III synthase [Thalassovita autumnalis]|uniref:Uroporphyrinogen-III synthase n=1 Tax=Thalassovita autumnalis TaxID=2072972 RepID=A0A0P1FDS3_9RHOB|nr:uroporphyrinogen-III synthase [Thalassovita autumnalis]CUH66223.1 uroporphyrinogen-III synthase [Thalassovita autumnalis]CUH72550.1 uroporphyrinogen-III synthase [Thalassovita autumnalis]
MAQLLLTRPQEGADRFAALLRRSGFDAPIVTSPLLQIVPLAAPDLPDLTEDQAVIFTSRNGVAAAPAGQRRLAYVVGAATGRAAAAAGYRVVQADGDAEALFRRILADHQAGNLTGDLVHLHGRHTRGDLAQRLTAAGIPTKGRVIYEQIVMPLSAAAKSLLSGTEPVILPIFSPRTAALLLAECQQMEGTAPLFVAAISPAADVELGALQAVQRHILPNPTADAMAAAVQRLMAAVQRLEGEIRQR